jgi:transposase
MSEAQRPSDGTPESTTPCFVGIDVAKAGLDVGVRPSGAQWRIANTEAELPALVGRLRTLAPRLVVLEATGGYARSAVAALAAAGLPVVVINPRQVRDACQGEGTRGQDRYPRRAGAGPLRRSRPS